VFAVLTVCSPAQAAPEVKPIVLVHGYGSGPDIWRGAEVQLREAGFDPISIPWRPAPGQRAPQAAVHVLLPAIESALAERGYEAGARFHAVGHSMGGLLLRFLIEHPWADVDDAWSLGGWSGDGVPDGDPEIAERVASLVMISTPNQGARTGVAYAACGVYHDKDWRPLGCDLGPKSPFVKHLGPRKPEGIAAPYLAVGVVTPAPFFFVENFDGDGDGIARGHDHAVMGEAVRLEGAPFALWRAWRQSDHFHVTCSTEVLGWVAAFAESGTEPPALAPRGPSTDACAGIPKEGWAPSGPSSGATSGR
jgi:pimeloyl-ACP methyl ester carboxylesterase